MIKNNIELFEKLIVLWSRAQSYVFRSFITVNIVVSVLLGANIPPPGEGSVSNSSTAESKHRYEVYKDRYSQAKGFDSDGTATSAESRQAFSKLHLDEKPIPTRGEIYLREWRDVGGAHGAPDIRRYTGQTHMNYSREDLVYPHHETLAVAQKKESGIDVGSYKRDEPHFIEKYYKIADKTLHNTDVGGCIQFDSGHGIDHAHTITYKQSNSTHDRINFTPQNSYYNQTIRRTLTGKAVSDGYSYKEVAIYPQHPLKITRKHHNHKENIPIPEGFILMLFNRITGNLVSSYYFPNLINYRDLLTELKAKTPSQPSQYLYFRDYFSIPNQTALDVWGNKKIEDDLGRRNAQMHSEHIGYRSSSGRYEILPNEHWSKASKNALIRTVSIYQRQRAAEYDDSVENMVCIAKRFNDQNFFYQEFSGTLHEPSLSRYWVGRVTDEIRRKKYDRTDIFYVLDERKNLPILPEVISEFAFELEKQLLDRPCLKDIMALMSFYDEEKNELKYSEWSKFLSKCISTRRISASHILTEATSPYLSDINVLNLIVTVPINEENIPLLIAELKKRAITEKQKRSESNLSFIEFTDISPEAVRCLMEFFENGFEYNGLRLFLDVRQTVVKLQEYSRKELREYMKKFPRTLIEIIE